MREKTFLQDPNLCLGCRACQMACAANRGLPPGVFLRRVSQIELRRSGQWVKYFLSSACHQCQNPECIRLCPEKALRKRRDGIVILDADKCSGCGVCLQGCPFEAPVRDPETGKVLKCDFCYERLDEGQMPFCVEACPVNALKLVTLTGGQEESWVRRLPGVPKVQLTHPSVRYYPLREGRQIRRHRPDGKEGAGHGEE